MSTKSSTKRRPVTIRSRNALLKSGAAEFRRMDGCGSINTRWDGFGLHFVVLAPLAFLFLVCPTRASQLRPRSGDAASSAYAEAPFARRTRQPEHECFLAQRENVGPDGEAGQHFGRKKREIGRRPRILVRAFSADATDEKHKHLGYLTTLEVGGDLGHVSSVVLIPGSVLSRLFLGRQEKLLALGGTPDVAKARAWCQEAHADLLVTGSTAATSAGVKITVRLMRPGQTRWLAERTFSGEDIFNVIDSGVRWILDQCNVTPTDDERRRMELRATTSMAAYCKLAEAARAQEEGRNFQAVGRCKKAIELDPRFARAHAQLGSIYAGLEQFDLAIAAFQKALAIDPGFSNRANLAVAYRKSDRAPMAFSEYAEVLRLRPHDPYVRVQLSSAHFHEKNYNQAEEALTEALRLDPFVADGHYSLGLVYRHSGRLGQAAAEFKQAVRDYPGDIQAYVMLATVHLLLGDIEAAINDLEEGVEISPDYGKAHNNLAAYYGGTEQYDKAWKHVHAAQRLRYPVADVIVDELRRHSVEPKND